MTPWPLTALLIFLAIAPAAAGCGGDDDNKGGNGKADTIISDTLQVGSAIPYKPFEFGEAPDYEGFDVEIVNAIGRRLDLKVKFVRTRFNPIFRNLAHDEFDMVASATKVERKDDISFSDPYFPADQSLMVKKGSDIEKLDDLRGKVVGAQLGTTAVDYAKRETDARAVRTYDLVDDTFKALQAGQIDAVINDFARSKFAEQSNPDLEVVEIIATDEKYGFAFAKTSESLRKAVNRALGEMKDDGTYSDVYRKWFKTDPPGKILEGGGREDEARDGDEKKSGAGGNSDADKTSGEARPSY